MVDFKGRYNIGIIPGIIPRDNPSGFFLRSIMMIDDSSYTLRSTVPVLTVCSMNVLVMPPHRQLPVSTRMCM